MTSRREFLQTGMAVSALPLAVNELLLPEAAASAVGTAVHAEACNVTLHKAIFDNRYAESRVFAREAGKRGVPTYALNEGDVTDLWYEELDLLWRKTPAAVAGLTQFGPMFVLERLANERGMRVAIRVEHQVRDDGTLTHVLSAPPESAVFADHFRFDMDWSALMAWFVTHCRTDCTTSVERTVVTRGAKPMLLQAPDADIPESIIHYYTPLGIREGRGVPFDGPLFSWVIARPVRA